LSSRSEFFERFREVWRRLRAVAADEYAALGVGTVQAKFLRHLGGEGRISQAELSRATDTAPALTGRALETLVERGWVRRKRSAEDRRRYVLELTAEGRRARDQVVKARAAVIRRIESVLDERDVADFDRIAAKILDELTSASGRARSAPTRPRSP